MAGAWQPTTVTPKVHCDPRPLGTNFLQCGSDRLLLMLLLDKRASKGEATTACSRTRSHASRLVDPKSVQLSMRYLRRAEAMPCSCRGRLAVVHQRSEEVKQGNRSRSVAMRTWSLRKKRKTRFSFFLFQPGASERCNSRSHMLEHHRNALRTVLFTRGKE